MSISFGEKIKAARKSKGFTQKQLAAKINAAHNSISDWENDKNKPDPDTIELLCGVLDITPNYLLAATSDDFSPKDKLLVRRYNNLDSLGQSHVDAVLQWETERVKQSEQDIKRIKELTELSRYVQDTSHYVNAAHPIDGASEEDKQFDEDIMNDENF